MRSVTLLQPLNVFPEASTKVPSAGRLSAGTLDALRVEQRGGDQYAQVAVWICTASQGVTYAVVNPCPAPVLSGIPESAITGYLQKFAGWTFSLNYPKYTAPIPNVPNLPLAPPSQNSCCIFVEDFVVHGFVAGRWAFEWGKERHDQMMVADWNQIWSPPQAVAEADLARPVVMPPSQTDALPEPWTLCQGWGPSTGHTFVAVAAHAETRKVLLLESNNAYGLNGPGFRGLGSLGNYLPDGPPPNWWEVASVPTWDQIRATYSTGIASAQLKVLTSTLVWGAAR